VVEEEAEEEPPAPAPKKTRAKAVVEVEDAVEVAEPEVRKETVKKPTTAAKGDLAAMVSDWDDEE
jgi:hypothetical protein